MRKLLIFLFVMFTIVALLGTASFGQSTKPFVVASVNVVFDTMYVTTETEKVNVAITYKGENTKIVAKRTIFICPKIGINQGTVTQIDCFRLADGRIISEKQTEINSKTILRLDSIARNKKQ